MVTKIKKFWVAINIIIGDEKINTMSGISRFRNMVINPIFFKSFLEKGSVCNHLKEFPDMKELVETRPNIIIYKSIIAKNIPKMKLDTKAMVFGVYICSGFCVTWKYITNGRRGKNVKRNENTIFNDKN